jgi:hypothetical protein
MRISSTDDKALRRPTGALKQFHIRRVDARFIDIIAPVFGVSVTELAVRVRAAYTLMISGGK